jgi:hypothetical protein
MIGGGEREEEMSIAHFHPYDSIQFQCQNVRNEMKWKEKKERCVDTSSSIKKQKTKQTLQIGHVFSYTKH